MKCSSEPENGSKVESGTKHHGPTGLTMDRRKSIHGYPMGVDEFKEREREKKGFNLWKLFLSHIAPCKKSKGFLFL